MAFVALMLVMVLVFYKVESRVGSGDVEGDAGGGKPESEDGDGGEGEKELAGKPAEDIDNVDEKTAPKT